jgi:hypothetical protein
LPYDIQLRPTEQAYLDHIGLSPRASASLDSFIDFGLAKVSDDFRNDPTNRPSPGKPFFVRDFFLVDIWGDERWHRVEFTVDDSHASQGVLVIVYVNHTNGDWTW